MSFLGNLAKPTDKTGGRAKSTAAAPPSPASPTGHSAGAPADIQAREIIFSAKEEAIKIRAAAEEEAKKLRQELVELEKKLAQKEEDLSARQEEIEEKKALLKEKLEQISGLSAQEAREEVLAAAEEKARQEAGKIIRATVEEAKLEAAKKAREILVAEMLHGTTDLVAEYTLSVVPVPSEEVKGRIIGKEGRNIRAFEQATGVDVELDEEGTIRLSSFDAVRREIARVAL
jgi:ribonuclease Y